MNLAKIKVLIIEDHELTRIGLSLIIEKSNKIELIGEANNGIVGISKAKRINPDIVLMDIGLPDIDGIEATKQIKNSNPNIKIIAFTSRNSENDVMEMFFAGADGYMMKGSTSEQIIRAIESVNEGVAWIDPAIAKLVLSKIQNAQRKIETKNNYDLTNREIEVLQLIVNGHSNEEIASKLFITVSTAKIHVHHILDKLAVKDRTTAAITAIKNNVVNF